MTSLLLIVLTSWLASVAAAAGALLLAVNQRAPRALILSLATISLAIGFLGFGRGSPFRFFPQLGYMWTSDSGDIRIQVASSWFFVAPLILGSVALLLLLARTTKNHLK